MIGPDATLLPEGPVPDGPTRASVPRAALSSWRRDHGSALRRRPALWIGLGLLIIATTLAIFGPFVWQHDPNAINILDNLQAPSLAHPMGTDEQGRDVFARVLSGARISLAVGGAVMVAGAVIGCLTGIISALSWGPVDFAFMRVMDSLLAFPPLILAMAVTIALGTGVLTASVGIVLTTIPWYARLVRADVLRIRSLPFYEASEALGASRRRLILRHITPHLSSTLLVQSASVFGYSILALAALGFVGLGAQIPTPEWGAMITDGLQSALTGQWWITVFPGIGLLVVVTGANVVADGLRDLLDPHADV